MLFRSIIGQTDLVGKIRILVDKGLHGLSEHPHFMRTSKFYVINLTKIRGLKVSSARDLWFEGLKEPVANAVTSTYLADFEKKLQ